PMTSTSNDSLLSCAKTSSRFLLENMMFIPPWSFKHLMFIFILSLFHFFFCIHNFHRITTDTSTWWNIFMTERSSSTGRSTTDVNTRQNSCVSPEQHVITYNVISNSILLDQIFVS